MEYQQVRGTERQAEIDRIREREKYNRKKCDRLQEQDKRPTNVQDIIESNDADDEREKLRQDVIELQYRNGILIAEIEENEVVELYDQEKRCYTTETQRKKPNRVPCTSTVREMSLQRLVIAHQQVAEELPRQENTTLETDETSKFGHKWVEVCCQCGLEPQAPNRLTRPEGNYPICTDCKNSGKQPQ